MTRACENCGHVERIYFQCPACGVSFEVKSEKSERIFLLGRVPEADFVTHGKSPQTTLRGRH